MRHSKPKMLAFLRSKALARKRLVVILLAAALLAVSAALVTLLVVRHHRYDPSVVRFDVAYNANLENQIYPSLILGISSHIPDSLLQNDSMALFRIQATAPCNQAVLTVIIDSSALNYTTRIQQVLRYDGHRYTIYPALKWKYDDLYRLRHSGTVDLTFHCLINDEEVDVKNLTLSYRSVNECLLNLTDTCGHSFDFRWMFTAYVNEEHPYIDSVLATILSEGVVHRFVGYQTTSEEVVRQVEAIWYYALNRGFTYSSTSTTSSPARRATVQAIRFFDEVYNLRQANCIDGCVFFASIMRKIGLKPLIFVVPGHAYLGYYTDKKRRNLKLLETTMTQWVDFPELTSAYNQTLELHHNAKGIDCLPVDIWNQYSKYLTAAQRCQWTDGKMTLDQLKRAVSHNLFIKATKYNTKSYQEHKSEFYGTDNSQYQVYDIEKSRRVVQPIAGDY